MSEKTYRFAIVGTGMIAHFHAKAIAAIPGADLVGVYNHNLVKAEKFAVDYACEAYADMDVMLANKYLDFVTICTPSGAHLEPALAAAKAGKHIICEKPLEVSIEKIDQMISTCQEAGVELIGILPRRFNESTKIFKEAIDQGRFGQVTLAEAQIKWWRSQEYYDSGAWRGTWALDGGGALMNQSIHTVDLLLHLMGDVKRVSAFASLAAHTGIEVEDVAVAILEFENGAKGVIQGSTTCYSKEGHPAQVQICGTEGSAFMVDDKFSVWEFRNEQEGDAEVLSQYGVDADQAAAGAADPSAIDFSWHQRNFEEAIAAVREGRKASVDGVEGRRAVELIGAIYASAQQNGLPVELPLKAMPKIKQF